MKTVITIQTQPYRMDNFINRRLFQLISLKKSSIFIGVSAIISKEMAEVFKIKQEKVKTIYNPICLDKDIIYNPNKGTKIMLAHVGRFHPVKDHNLLIDSFFLAQKEDPNLILNLFGDGEMKDLVTDFIVFGLWTTHLKIDNTKLLQGLISFSAYCRSHSYKFYLYFLTL